MSLTEIEYSIVIITAYRKREFFQCVNSVLREFQDTKFEIITVFNGDRSYAKDFEHQMKKIVLDIAVTPAQARNMAIDQVSGKSVFFLDDDAVLPNDYFSHFSTFKEWDILGGPDQTPIGSTELENDFGYVLSSPFCMGKTFYRHSRNTSLIYHANESHFQLCNLWIKKTLLENNRFHPKLFRNEENHWIKNNLNKNHISIYSPSLFVYHKRRSDLQSFFQMIQSNAYYRIVNLKLSFKLQETIYFTPLLILIGFVALATINTLITLKLVLGSLIFLIAYSMIRFKKINSNFIFLHYAVIFFYALGLLEGLIYGLSSTKD